ncbi:MAG TPA: hypothetical protein VHZ49_20295 [Methylomirabilota bacterium]|jgi:hypothetical protein|nr:hypothetical protein [Methylomirabilota bacterium]
MTRKLGFVAPFLAALLLMLGTELATADDGIHRLPGAWHAVVTPNHFGGFPALFLFTSDGAVIGSESPGSFESPVYGSWVRRGRDVAFTFFGLFGAAAGGGQNTGSSKVVGTLRFDARSGGWNGRFRIQVFNAAGTQIFLNEGTVEFTPIEVEDF